MTGLFPLVLSLFLFSFACPKTKGTGRATYTSFLLVQTVSKKATELYAQAFYYTQVISLEGY